MRKIDEQVRPNSCLNKALRSELLFVLLGRDPAAPNVVRFWTQERIRMGLNKVSDPQIIEALNCVNEMSREVDALRHTIAESRWDYHPAYPPKDWQREVAESDTRLGYWEWVEHKIQEELSDE